MKSFLSASFVTLSLLVSVPSFAASKFVQKDEDIRSEMVGDLSVAVFEDFVQNSLAPADMIAFEGQTVLIIRDGILCLLVPEAIYDDVIHQTGIILPPAISLPSIPRA